jgi:putative lipoprotein
MKKALIALTLAVAAIGASAKPVDPWNSTDKYEHAIGSAIIGATAMAVTKSEVKALTFSIGVGLAKELYDQQRYKKHGVGYGFSYKDLTWDIAGAVAGTYGMKFILSRNAQGTPQVVYNTKF